MIAAANSNSFKCKIRHLQLHIVYKQCNVPLQWGNVAEHVLHESEDLEDPSQKDS